MGDIGKISFTWCRRACIALVCTLILSSCADENTGADVGIIARVGTQKLSVDDLRQAIPGGLSPEDSVMFVKAYVKDWIDTRLTSEVAADEIDMKEIDRLVEQYRNILIMREYRRRMFETHADSISLDSVNAYYEKHKNQYVLERPLVKGVYLKIPDDADNLNTLKRLYRSGKSEDIDKLEKEVLKSAIHYDYFRDRWVDWEQIETRVPYDFGKSADSWLVAHRNLDASVGGFTYLLYVTEVLPSGTVMPVEVAKPDIINRLLNLNRQEYDARLTRDLFQSAKQSGKLQINIELD